MTSKKGEDDAGAAQEPKPPLPPDIEELHRQVVARGEESYEDPATGYTVFTELFHRKRGNCCGNRCRHCPYGWENVGKKGSARILRGKGDEESEEEEDDDDDDEEGEQVATSGWNDQQMTAAAAVVGKGGFAPLEAGQQQEEGPVRLAASSLLQEEAEEMEGRRLATLAASSSSGGREEGATAQGCLTMTTMGFGCLSVGNRAYTTAALSSRSLGPRPWGGRPPLPLTVIRGGGVARWTPTVAGTRHTRLALAVAAAAAAASSGARRQ